MENRYRLHTTSVDDMGERLPLTLWEGEAYPLDDDIAQAARVMRPEVRSPFRQAERDYLRVQQKRRIGWKTVDVINIFEPRTAEE